MGGERGRGSGNEEWQTHRDSNGLRFVYGLRSQFPFLLSFLSSLFLSSLLLSFFVRKKKTMGLAVRESWIVSGFLQSLFLFFDLFSCDTNLRSLHKCIKPHGKREDQVRGKIIWGTNILVLRVLIPMEINPGSTFSLLLPLFKKLMI